MSDTTSTATPGRHRAASHDGDALAREPHGIPPQDYEANHILQDGPATGSTVSPRVLVYADPASRALANVLGRIAPTDVPVMISGEPGTGKGELARHIHKISGRRGTFVSVNCSAVAEQLAQGDSNLITTSDASAVTASGERWFEAARQGTLFLDEIAALPGRLQGQLLRLLQDQEVAQAAARDPKPADVRLVAATTIDLSEAVSAGHFRVELFYRLNVGPVQLLPLRQRRGDVAALAAHFLNMHAARSNLPPRRLGEQALSALTQYSWPGNIRELENVIRFALLVAPGQELRTEHLRLGGSPSAAATTSQAIQATAFSASGEPAGKEPPAHPLSQLLTPMFHSPGENLLSDLEQQIVTEAFRFTRRNQVRTAALLGISRNVLRTLLKKHGLLVVRRRTSRNRGVRL